MRRGVGGSSWCRTGAGGDRQLVAVLLVCVVLVSSASTAVGARPGPAAAGGMGNNAPGPDVVTRPRGDVAGATTTVPPVATTTSAADPYQDSKRKVPNGPDPIHNSAD
uniref:Uncharacterized protein n=1 Tax=Oryza brachyantha TaxID=4533 RepID=J3LRR5_ORYBR